MDGSALARVVEMVNSNISISWEWQKQKGAGFPFRPLSGIVRKSSEHHHFASRSKVPVNRGLKSLAEEFSYLRSNTGSDGDFYCRHQKRTVLPRITNPRKLILVPAYPR
jgi:hypothetical protein